MTRRARVASQKLYGDEKSALRSHIEDDVTRETRNKMPTQGGYYRLVSSQHQLKLTRIVWTTEIDTEKLKLTNGHK